MVEVDRGNWNGRAYPPLFYTVMSVFVGDSVPVSTVLMRAFNALLYVGLLTALFFLLPTRMRPALVWGALITAVPLGMFLIASVNPSSWAITSASGVWVATWGFFVQRPGRRKWMLAGLTVVLLIIGAGARSDAAVYGVLAMIAGSVLGFRKDRRYALELILPLALALVAAWIFLSAGQSAVVGASTVVEHTDLDTMTLIQRNLMDLPLLWIGIFGLWGMGGLGWLDTAVPGAVWVSTLVIFGAVAFWGVRRGDARKWLSLAGVTLALIVVPMYILVHDGVTVGAGVQPRYILPLLIIFAGVALVGWQGAGLGLGRVQLSVVAAVLAIANSLSLHTNMRRYLTGVDVDAVNLDANAEWWWNTPVSPMTVWVVGSLAFAAVLVALAAVAWQDPVRDATRLPLGDGAAEPDPSTKAYSPMSRG